MRVQTVLLFLLVVLFYYNVKAGKCPVHPTPIDLGNPLPEKIKEVMFFFFFELFQLNYMDLIL